MALAAIGTGTGIGTAATSTITVGAIVPSTTSISMTGCPSFNATRTTFMPLAPGASDITDDDCDVLFGSSNDTATLRAYQPNANGTAMSGTNTTVVPTGSGGRMFDVDMADGSTGWAVGETGKIFLTTSGGATWDPVTVPGLGTVGLEGIDAVSPTIAWASTYNSNQFTRTVDGATWSALAPMRAPDESVISGVINRIIAWDADVAWALGWQSVSGSPRARIWRTTDAGAHWSLVWSSASANTEVHEGDVVSATNVFAVTTAPGLGVIASTDGTTFTSANAPGTSYRDVDAIDANRIVAATEGRHVYTTTDGGTSWVDRDVPVETQWLGVDYEPSGIITIGGIRGTVIQSPDHGVTWTTLDQDADLGKILSLDAGSASQIAFVTYGSTIVSSRDAGATWTANTQSNNGNWAHVDGVDAGRLWRVGARGRIQTSTDGGQAWTDQTPGVTTTLTDVVALSRTTAVIVGVDGVILRTTDGGDSWSSIASGTTKSLYAITAAPDGLTLWAGGLDGTLLRSSDAGGTWSTQASGVTSPIWAIGAWSQHDAIVGMAGGSDLVRTTTDGGATWTTSAAPADTGIMSVVAVPDTETALLVEEYDLSTTPDGGATWTSQSVTPETGSFTDLHSTDGITIWATGLAGRVARSLDAGATWTDFTGGSTSRQGGGVVGLGLDAAVAVMEGNYAKYTDEPTPMPDYDGAGSGFGGANGFFGVCLRAAPGTTVGNWAKDGTCDASDGAEWHGLPLHGGLAASMVATTLAPGTTTASFRFGVKVGQTQTAGSYSAGIVFEVAAPG